MWVAQPPRGLLSPARMGGSGQRVVAPHAKGNSNGGVSRGGAPCVGEWGRLRCGCKEGGWLGSVAGASGGVGQWAGRRGGGERQGTRGPCSATAARLAPTCFPKMKS